MSIRIIATGGTFDKIYQPTTGELVFDKTHIDAMLLRARVTDEIKVQTVLLKDSLEMTEEDRQCILKACQAATENQIVIVHGTDTMHQTALVLAKANLNKTIVLVGAMVPYSISNSDAFFNLGYAMASAQHLNPNVYIAMNGKIFTWDNVQKNRQKGVFENLK